MMELDQQAKEAGITVMNEIGLGTPPQFASPNLLLFSVNSKLTFVLRQTPASTTCVRLGIACEQGIRN